VSLLLSQRYIGAFDAQLLAQNLAFGRLFDRRHMPAEAGQVRGMDEALEIRELQAVRARPGEAKNLPHAVAKESNAAPAHVVDVDDIRRGTHNAPQHVLCALPAVPCSAVEHHGGHAPALNSLSPPPPAITPGPHPARDIKGGPISGRSM
jgi:hypothetical protein